MSYRPQDPSKEERAVMEVKQSQVGPARRGKRVRLSYESNTWSPPPPRWDADGRSNFARVLSPPPKAFTLQDVENEDEASPTAHLEGQWGHAKSRDTLSTASEIARTSAFPPSLGPPVGSTNSSTYGQTRRSRKVPKVATVGDWDVNHVLSSLVHQCEEADDNSSLPSSSQISLHPPQEGKVKYLEKSQLTKPTTPSLPFLEEFASPNLFSVLADVDEESDNAVQPVKKMRVSTRSAHPPAFGTVQSTAKPPPSKASHQHADLGARSSEEKRPSRPNTDATRLLYKSGALQPVANKVPRRDENASRSTTYKPVQEGSRLQAATPLQAAGITFDTPHEELEQALDPEKHEKEVIARAIANTARRTTFEYRLRDQGAMDTCVALLIAQWTLKELRVIRTCQTENRAPGVGEIRLGSDLNQNGIYLRQHLFRRAREAIRVLERLQPVYAQTLANGMRQRGNLDGQAFVSYAGKEESAMVTRTIETRMKEHDSGRSGAVLEQVFGPAAKGVEAALLKSVVFDQATIESVADCVAGGRGASQERRAMELMRSFNCAEALAAAIWHTHCADTRAPGTNCTACGQVFGAVSSQRINTVINSVKSMQGEDADLEVPALDYVTHDNGLKELVGVVALAKGIAEGSVTLRLLQSAIQSHCGVESMKQWKDGPATKPGFINKQQQDASDGGKEAKPRNEAVVAARLKGEDEVTHKGKRIKVKDAKTSADGGKEAKLRNEAVVAARLKGEDEVTHKGKCIKVKDAKTSADGGRIGGKANNTGAGFAQLSDGNKYVKLCCDGKKCGGVVHEWQVITVPKPAVRHGKVGLGQRVAMVKAHPECDQYERGTKPVSRKVSGDCVSDTVFDGVRLVR